MAACCAALSCPLEGVEGAAGVGDDLVAVRVAVRIARLLGHASHSCSTVSGPSIDVGIDDREALRSARRQFHTIKGSGRMVGLNELGELAYDVEQIHNRLLEEDRDVTPAMLELS